MYDFSHLGIISRCIPVSGTYTYIDATTPMPNIVDRNDIGMLLCNMQLQVMLVEIGQRSLHLKHWMGHLSVQ